MPAIPEGVKVVHNSPAREKMSDVLEEFVQPLEDPADTEESYMKLLTLGMLAWNAALQPEDQRQAFIDRMIAVALPGAPQRDRATVRQVVDMLIQRKQQLFPNNRRVIISFSLTDRGDDFHLSVVSTL